METSCKNGPSQTSYGNLTARETVHSMERRNFFLRIDQDRIDLALITGSKHIPPGLAGGDLLAKRKATGSQAFGHELPKAGPGSSFQPALTREQILSYPNLLGKLLPNKKRTLFARIEHFPSYSIRGKPPLN